MIDRLSAVLTELGSLVVLSATVSANAHAMDRSRLRCDGNRANLLPQKIAVN
jgi:hypothetical protein